MDWVTIERPGYFGDKRDEIYEKYNQLYGKNWRLAWQFGQNTLEMPEALQIYEDGYYEHLKNKPELLAWLVKSFSDVYDTAPSNVKSKFRYDIQETPSNHLHDIAIRRAALRLGVWFSGAKLLEVRSANAEGWILSPCMIPFHLPELIYQGQIEYKGEARDFSANPPWWITKGIKNSVEEFYQQNKLLQVRR